MSQTQMSWNPNKTELAVIWLCYKDLAGRSKVRVGVGASARSIKERKEALSRFYEIDFRPVIGGAPPSNPHDLASKNPRAFLYLWNEGADIVRLDQNAAECITPEMCVSLFRNENGLGDLDTALDDEVGDFSDVVSKFKDGAVEDAANLVDETVKLEKTPKSTELFESNGGHNSNAISKVPVFWRNFGGLSPFDIQSLQRK